MTATVQVAIQPPTRVTRTNYTRRERRELQIRSPLDLELRKIGVTPLSTESVRHYMKQRVEEARNPKPIIEEVRGWKFRHALAFIMSGLALIIATVVGNSQFTIATTLVFLVSMSGLWYGLCGTREKFTRLQLGNSFAKWRKFPLDYYVQVTKPSATMRLSHYIESPPVPPQVLAKARQVQALPGVQAFVHCFDNDPLIEVEHFPRQGRSSSRFIACWDEEGFVP